MTNKLIQNWFLLSGYSKREILFKTSYFDVVHYRIVSEKVPSPVKLIFLSDLHFGSYPPPSAEIAKTVNSINPSHIIFGGDLASDSSGLEDGFNMLSMLKSRNENFAVLGNWELKRSRCKKIFYWRTRFAESGFTLLHDKIKETKDSVFYGISPTQISLRKRIKKKFSSDKFVTVVAHNPDDIVSAELNFELAFAGHTHAGQIRLPFIGALKTSSAYWKKFEYGLYQRSDGAKFIVSAGLGTSCLPLRFLCKPEIVLVEVNPLQKS